MAVKRAIETNEQIRGRITDAVAMSPDLDGVDLRVFLYLVSRLGFEEYVVVRQVEMVVMLARRKEHISRAIRRLTEQGVIVPSAKGTRASEWRLNADYGR